MAVYLIPCPIEEGNMGVLPPLTLQVLHLLTCFAVERAKTARHFIKDAKHPAPLSTLDIVEIGDQNTPWKEVVQSWLIKDISFGIISEAGCPGIADPGAEIIAMAHLIERKVVPLVGPSSILLALMASGMNGQSFSFHGYLPNKRNELIPVLKKLEKEALSGTTQIFMEAPYRNAFLLEVITSNLKESTLVCLACDINHASESILTKTVASWKKTDGTTYHKRPCIFLIGKLV